MKKVVRYSVYSETLNCSAYADTWEVANEICQFLIKAGGVDAKIVHGGWEICDEDDGEYGLPETYAEIDYGDREDAEAIDGMRWDDMNYNFYMER